MMRSEIIRRGDASYPKRLERLTDPPWELHVCGTLPDLPGVAIVGSRKADTVSCRFAAKLAGDLARQGICVVSGGAFGVDTAAHRGALDAGGATVAVIGSGFNFLYPEENRALFDEIAASGALLTELAPEQPPTRWTFPKRNRIVAAMSLAVVVAQAGERSGALITARLAGELGVPVGACPGMAGDPRNRGNHRLLRQGAPLVESAADVAALMSTGGKKEQLHLPGLDSGAMKPIPKPKTEHSPTEVKILDILCSSPLHIDEITAATGLGPGESSAAVLELELQGLIEDQGGKRYVRVG